MNDKLPVIYRPELIGLTGPIAFSCPRPKVKARGEKNTMSEVVELLSVWVVPGTNFYSRSEVWEPLMAHPTTKAQIESFVRRAVIITKLPTVLEGNIPTDTTADYPDLQDARDLTFYSYDAEWLRRCIAKDNRTQVTNWCYERIEEIEKVRNRPQAEPEVNRRSTVRVG